MVVQSADLQSDSSIISSSGKNRRMANDIEHVDVLVLGAGPTGLGAASRLAMQNNASWLLMNADKEAFSPSRVRKWALRK